MDDWEKLKALIAELHLAGDNPNLFTEDYVELCQRKIAEAAEIIERMPAPHGAA